MLKNTPHNSTEYLKTVSLREELLRKPLGMKFSKEELALEKDQVHLSLWEDEELLGCLVMVKSSQKRWKMRQVAVRADLQGKGIGQKLILASERWLLARGVTEIYLHAREPVVQFYEKLGYQIEGDRFYEVSIPHFLMNKRFSGDHLQSKHVFVPL